MKLNESINNPNIKEMFLPVNHCFHCDTENNGFGIQCKNCGARVVFKQRLKKNTKTISFSDYTKNTSFKKVDISTPEGKNWIEHYDNHKIWLCDCGLANFNLPVNQDDLKVTCEGCGREYKEGENILPLDALNGFGFDDGNDYSDDGELRKGKELLLLWQETLIKIQEIDSANGNKNEYEKIINEIEKIKQNAFRIYGRQGRVYADGDELILFLKKYLGKEKVKVYTILTQKHLKKTFEEKPTKSILTLSTTILVPILLYFFAPYNKAAFKKASVYTVSKIEIHKKNWLDKNFIVNEYIPYFDAGKNTVVYIKKGINSYKNGDNEFFEHKSSGHKIIMGAMIEKYGVEQELPIGESKTVTNKTCVATKVGLEILEGVIKATGDGGGGHSGNHSGGGYHGGHSGGSHHRSKSHGGGGIGFGHGGGMSFNDGQMMYDMYLQEQKNYNGYVGLEYVASSEGDILPTGYKVVRPESSEYIDHDWDHCKITYQLVIKAPIKYDIQKYEVYDWDPKLTETMTKKVDGIDPIYPKYNITNDSEKVIKSGYVSYADITIEQGGKEKTFTIDVVPSVAQKIQSLSQCEYTYSKFQGADDIENIIEKCSK